jgi:hypothetical protein
MELVNNHFNLLVRLNFLSVSVLSHRCPTLAKGHRTTFRRHVSILYNQLHTPNCFWVSDPVFRLARNLRICRGV